MLDGFIGDFEFSSGHDMSGGFDAEPRRPWVTPELEELLPGTERYERAVAAFQEMKDRREADDADPESGQG